MDSEGRKPRLAASGMANEDKARVYWDSLVKGQGGVGCTYLKSKYDGHGGMHRYQELEIRPHIRFHGGGSL